MADEVIQVRWTPAPQRAYYATPRAAPPPPLPLATALRRATDTSVHARQVGRLCSANGDTFPTVVSNISRASPEQGSPAETPRAAEAREPPQPGGWEYLDHTADVQIHSWGATDAEAFAAAAVGLFGYMVDLDEFDTDISKDIQSSGHDWESMLFGFLDECLYVFCTEAIALTRITVHSIDTKTWTVTATAKGSRFIDRTHTPRTEVKAITYSNMQILRQDDDGASERPPEKRAQVYVIVDI